MRYLISALILAAVAIAMAQSGLFADAPPNQPTAAPEPPHSPAALDAKRRYDLTVKQALDLYRKAVVDADQAYIHALTQTEDTAMKAGISEKSEADRLETARLAMTEQMSNDQQLGKDQLPSGDSTGNLKGKWTVSYANGVIRHYVVSGDGSVKWIDGDQNSKINNGVIVFPDDKLERWTKAGNRILVEHYTPKSSFPNGNPSTIGIGVASN